MIKNQISCECLTCNKEFFTIISRIRIGRGKFCSKKCYYKSKIGNKGYWIGKKRINFSEKWRKNMSNAHKRKNNGMWKGGKIKNNGYNLILNPKHPHCDSQGYVRKHRIIAEKILNRYLTSQEVIHHINKITTDNRPKNLYLFSNNIEHLNYHRRKIKPILKSNLL